MLIVAHRSARQRFRLLQARFELSLTGIYESLVQVFAGMAFRNSEETKVFLDNNFTPEDLPYSTDHGDGESQVSEGNSEIFTD